MSRRQERRWPFDGPQYVAGCGACGFAVTTGNLDFVESTSTKVVFADGIRPARLFCTCQTEQPWLILPRAQWERRFGIDPTLGP